MNKKLLSLLLLFFAFAIPFQSFAQDDDDDSLLDIEEPTEEEEETFERTFTASRIVTGHSVETLEEGVLDFRISHRFDAINSGPKNLWGLDGAYMRMSLEYGVTDELTVGLGRSNSPKLYDGFLKYKLAQQKEDGMPFTATWLSSMYMDIEKPSGHPEFFWRRLSYVHEVMIARRFNEKLSLQLTTAMVHSNIVKTKEMSNQAYVVGLGGKYNITKRLSVNAEYFHVLNSDKVFQFDDNGNPLNFNNLSVGVDIETGGHVFQLHLTNSRGMVERGFMTQSSGDWLDGGIHFGFNVSRIFLLK